MYLHTILLKPTEISSLHQALALSAVSDISHLTSTKGLTLQDVRSLHKVPFPFQCIQHPFSWEASKQACRCPEKHRAFQSLQSQGGHPRMATGAISTCFPPAKATSASVAASENRLVFLSWKILLMITVVGTGL